VKLTFKYDQLKPNLRINSSYADGQLSSLQRFVTNYKLYSLPDIIRKNKSRRMRWAGHVARMGEGRKVYRVLVGKPKGKSPLERPRRRWEGRARTRLREIGWGGVEWIHLAQDRDRWGAVVNAVINLQVLGPRSWLCVQMKILNTNNVWY
jgi:hypothetical protein